VVRQEVGRTGLCRPVSTVMTVSERLIKRLRAMGMDVPDASTLQRTHAGISMRQRGAWSWSLIAPGGHELCGSYHPATGLLRSNMVVVTGEHGVPEVVLPSEVLGRTYIGQPSVLFSEAVLSTGTTRTRLPDARTVARRASSSTSPRSHPVRTDMGRMRGVCANAPPQCWRAKLWKQHRPRHHIRYDRPTACYGFSSRVAGLLDGWCSNLHA